MTNRLESAATTRRALLDAAAALLDAGGPEAVTLRAVGARAGVSRNAPYRHFADKEGLLTAVAVESWERLAATFRASSATDPTPERRLERALLAIVDLGRQRPHQYRLMFIIPDADPDVGARAASRALDAFLAIVVALVGAAEARHYGALLFSSAHGIADLAISGHLTTEKWRTDTEPLIATLVAMTAAQRSANTTVDGARHACRGEDEGHGKE